MSLYGAPPDWQRVGVPPAPPDWQCAGSPSTPPSTASPVLVFPSGWWLVYPGSEARSYGRPIAAFQEQDHAENFIDKMCEPGCGYMEQVP